VLTSAIKGIAEMKSDGSHVILVRGAHQNRWCGRLVDVVIGSVSGCGGWLAGVVEDER
jgi:hypothetical protein